MTRASFRRRKSNTNALQMDANQAQSNTGTMERAHLGKSFPQIGLTGRACSCPRACASEKLKGKHSVLGRRTGNCLYMRVSNCSGIKRIERATQILPERRGRRYGGRLTITEKWKQDLQPHSEIGFRDIPRVHPSLSQETSAHLNRKTGIPSEFSGAGKWKIYYCWSRFFSLLRRIT